ncbi:MAG: T9SS type A sorting domain-containing protein [Flavobacteriia bacterium]|nr:T9SS type A sorting domain-containing protein [Flavobacteriia bacterium]
MKKLLLSASLLISALGAQAQLAPGSIAPDFTVSAYQPWLSTAGMNNNGTYNLYDYLDAGYTVILDVSATWCGPCWNYHLTGALEDAYAAHGPSGALGVSANTTDDLMVIWIEGDGATADATMLDGSGTIGNWINPNNGGQIQFPMANPASASANTINDDFGIGYFPTIYKICPNRIVSEIGQAAAAAIYTSIGSCPPPASAPVDAAALTYEGSLVHCQGSYTPSVKIQNNGLNPLTTATVTITQNGSTVSTGTYSGSIATYGLATVNCSPITNFMGGALAVTITTANDANGANNTVNALVSAAQVAASQYVTVNITTDAFATETSWTIKNPAGTTVASGGGFGPDLTVAGETVETPVNATLTPNTCYTFEILDAYGDGILGNYGNGGYSIVDAVGTVLASGGAFGASEQKVFKTGVLGVDELNSIALNVYPNPASDLVNISFEGENTDYSISLMDIQGRVISSREIANASGEQVVSFSTENVAKGSYLILN